MAANDLLNEVQKDSIKLDDDSEKKANFAFRNLYTVKPPTNSRHYLKEGDPYFFRRKSTERN